MIQHLWTIASRFSIANQETNNISLLEVIEELTIPIPPPSKPDRGLVPALFDIVSLWARDEDDEPVAAHGKMVLVAPDGRELTEFEYEIDLRNNSRFRHVGRMLGFPASTAGRYEFRVMHRLKDDDGWTESGVLPLWIHIIRPEEATNKNGDRREA